MRMPTTWTWTRPRGAFLLMMAVAMTLALVAPAGAAEVPPLQPHPAVTGVQIVQGDGFATVTWDPVEDADEYQIERVEVDASDSPVGTAAIVGVWRANRATPQDRPTFADAGFVVGKRYRWRVRVSPAVQLPAGPSVELPIDPPFSEPVFDTTNAEFGDPTVAGENLRTGWETTLAAQYTSDTDEYAYTAALDAATDRVRVVELGRTVQDRPINMIVLGYPAPPATAEEISASPTAMVNCNVHGNEPSSREACLILARELAFGSDERTIDLLSNVTVLIVPAINGDGRAANSRGNSTGQDLNRDHSLLSQPETRALAEAVRDYTPDAGFDGHEYGNSTAGDLPVMLPRHLNVAEAIWDANKAFMEGFLYEQGSADGWWYCPYGCEGGSTVGMSQETILRNTLGLKNMLSTLVEARSSGGATRPDETNTPNNRRRKTYSALYTYQIFLDHFRANTAAIQSAVAEAVAFQESNSGPIVWRGSRSLPPYPAPHPGESPPNDEAPSGMLDPAPCAYDLTQEQYSAKRDDGPEGMQTSVGERMASHGWTVQQTGEGYRVPLAQPQRGLIPLLLDGEAEEPWLAAERVYDCAA